MGAEVCGAGKVKVIILSDKYGAPDEVILENVEAHIEEERQIGAEVTVVAATPKAATVVVTVKVASGYNITDIRQNVQAALQSYIDSVNREDFVRLLSGAMKTGRAVSAITGSATSSSAWPEWQILSAIP